MKNIKLFLLIVLSGVINAQEVSRKDKVLKDWAADSVGCLELRNKQSAFFIKDSIAILEKNKTWILNNLGTPNNKNDETFDYYFDTFCHKSLMIDSSDYCILKVEFDTSNKVDGINIVCF